MTPAVETQIDLERRRLLEALGAGASATEELMEFNRPRTHWASTSWPLSLDSTPEPHVADWARYAEESRTQGLGQVLGRVFRQLGFPVELGMSQSPEYRSALRGSKLDSFANRHEFGEGHIELRETAAGLLPLLWLDRRADFVHLVRCLLHKNEPVPVPESMGAALIVGYRNWERIDRRKQAFSNGEISAPESRWGEYLQRIARNQPEQISDRFVLLSSGTYSALGAESVKLEPSGWERASLQIRAEHECGHYLTRRWLGFMSELPLDELALDSAAVARTQGSGNPDWVKRFLGVEVPRGARIGARLWNYRGNPPISDAAFEIEGLLVRRAIEHWEAARQELEKFGHSDPSAALVLASTLSTLEEVAGPEGCAHLARLGPRCLPTAKP